MLLQARDAASRAPPFVSEATGQRYKQTMQLLYLGGDFREDADVMVEIRRRVQRVKACYKRFGPELYDMTTARLSLTIRVLSMR